MMRFAEPLAPNGTTRKDGELIDDAARHDGNKNDRRRHTKMEWHVRFKRATHHYSSNGRFVIVFAHKHPDAWETLVSAIIRAGFRC